MDQFYDESMRGLPIGNDDFIEVRESDAYYVDKTRLISRILDSRVKTFLFTRPRRFGKSLNISMLDAFLNMRYRGNGWFEGLQVDDRDDLSCHRNAYPVIRLDLGMLSSGTFEDFEGSFSYMVSRLFASFGYLEESQSMGSDAEAFSLLRHRRADGAALRNSVAFLCEILERHHGIKPVILVDEYDKPINSSLDKEPFDRILDFMRDFYTCTFKSNQSRGLSVLTGVMQIAKESIFSGLNNLYVDSVVSEGFGDCFGFTEDEVKGILLENEHPERFDECREWYDGYRFGGVDVYNPWSVNMYVTNGFRPAPYWGRTSSNDIIGRLVDLADEGTYSELQSLGGGGAVTKRMSSVSAKDVLDRKDAVYSVMAMAGYLNVSPVEGGYALTVPNRELYDVFYDALMERLDTSVRVSFDSFFKALESGDAMKVEENAFSIFETGFRSFQLKDEGDYQLVIAGAAMGLLGRYTVKVEEDAGNGRADLILLRNSPRYPNIVVEFKRSVSDDPEDWMKGAEEGLEQMKRQEYYHSLKGRTLLYGICFRNKRAKALMEELRLRCSVVLQSNSFQN